MERNLALVAKVIAFIETLPSLEDPNETIKLEDFQKDYIERVYGPVTTDSNERIVRQVRQAVLTL